MHDIWIVVNMFIRCHFTPITMQYYNTVLVHTNIDSVV